MTIRETTFRGKNHPGKVTIRETTVYRAVHVRSRWKIEDRRQIKNTENTQTKNNPEKENNTQQQNKTILVQ